MTNEIVAAIIGIGGVIFGALISEILRYAHNKRRLIQDRSPRFDASRQYWTFG
jgi:hypothetical protein